MKKLLYAVIFLVVFVVGLTFAAKNPQDVAISYYFGVDLELPLTVVLLGTLVAGVLIGYVFALAGSYRRYRRRQARRESRREVERSAGTSLVTRSG